MLFLNTFAMLFVLSLVSGGSGASTDKLDIPADIDFATSLGQFNLTLPDSQCLRAASTPFARLLDTFGSDTFHVGELCQKVSDASQTKETNEFIPKFNNAGGFSTDAGRKVMAALVLNKLVKLSAFILALELKDLGSKSSNFSAIITEKQVAYASNVKLSGGTSIPSFASAPATPASPSSPPSPSSSPILTLVYKVVKVPC